MSSVEANNHRCETVTAASIGTGNELLYKRDIPQYFRSEFEKYATVDGCKGNILLYPPASSKAP